MKMTVSAAFLGLAAGSLAAFAWRPGGGEVSGGNSPRSSPTQEKPASPAAEQHSLAALRALIDPADVSGSEARVYRAVQALPPEALSRLAKEVLVALEGDRDLWRLALLLEERWMELFPEEAVAFAAQSKGRTLKALERVAARDPEEAERLFLTVPVDLRTQAWVSLLAGLTDRDPLAALARATGRRPDGEEIPREHNWRITVYQRWAEKDPATAAAHFQNHATPEELKRDTPSLVRSWMENDPAAALAFARELKIEEYQVNPVLIRLAERDPVKALAELKNAHVAFERGDPVVSTAWRVNPAAVLAELEKRPEGKVRDDFQTAVVIAMMETGVEEARAYVDKLTDPKAKQRGASILAGRMAKENPAAAAQWYLENTNGTGSQGMDGLAHLMRAYAAEAPGEALAWAQKLDEKERESALETILPEWLKEDTGAAAKAVLALPEGTGRQEALETLSRRWAVNAPEEAVGWAKSLTGPDRAEALLAAARGCHQEAAQPVGQRAVEELLRDPAAVQSGYQAHRIVNAVSAVSGAWTDSSRDAAKAEEALKWIESLPSGQVREESVKNWISSRVSSDSLAASQWIQAQPRGELRDHGAGQLARQLHIEDPAAAFAWAADIGEERLRRDTLEMTMRTWRKTGVEAPRQAIENSALPEAEKVKLLETLKP